MNLEEAKAKLKVTPEERAAVADYANMYHARMNSVIGFNMVEYMKSGERWLLTGTDIKQDTPEQEVQAMVDEIFQTFDQASLVYSAMLKSSRSMPPSRLMRGASAKEALGLRKGGTYNRILSTTTDKEVAMSFTRAGDQAFMRISADSDVPFLDVTEFVGEDKLNRLESEIIFAPFAKVTDSRMTSNWQNCKYYDVHIAKPEMRAFEEGEKETLASEIRASFAEVMALRKEFAEARSTLEEVSEQLHQVRSGDYRSVLFDRQKEAWAVYERCAPAIRAFEEKMSHYAQGLFMEREKELTQSQEIVNEEERRISAEREAARKKEALETATSNIKNTGSKVSVSIDKTPDLFSVQYQALRREEQKYSRIADVLRIPYSLRIPKSKETSMESSLATIASNVETIKSRIADATGRNFESVEEANNASNEIGAYSVKTAGLQDKANVLYDTVGAFSKQSEFEMKKGVDERIQDMIKRTRLLLIARQRQELQERKISFFGRLRGLGKLRDAEIENLNLQEQIIRNTPIRQKADYTVEDSLAELKAFSKDYLGNALTYEMKDFKDAIVGFYRVSETEVENRAQMKRNKALPAVVEAPKKRMSTSKKIQNATQEGQRLQAELHDTIQSRGSAYYPVRGNANSNPIATFAATLEQAVNSTMPEPTQEQLREAKEAQRNQNSRQSRPRNTYDDYGDRY